MESPHFVKKSVETTKTKRVTMNSAPAPSSLIQWEVSTSTTLLEELSKKYPQQSQRTLRHWVQYGRLSLNGEPVKKSSTALEKGDWLEIGPWPRFLKGPSFLGQSIPIIFEDKDMIVLDKPCHLLSVADEAHSRQNLFSIVKQSYPEAFVVHRLDAKTQGLIVFAKNRRAGEQIKTLLEGKNLRRRYMAICYGQFPEDELTWENFLHEDAIGHVHVIEESDPRITRSKLSKTRVRLLEQGKSLCLLEFELDTGRKHQIRAQAAHHGFGIFCDDRYQSDQKKIPSKDPMALLSWQLSWPKTTLKETLDTETEEKQYDVTWNEATSSFLREFEARWQICKKR